MKPGAVVSEYKKMSDEELVHRYSHRHEQATLTHLFDRYGHLVFGVCLSYMKNVDRAANATHAIFIKLVSDLERGYDARQFKPWLYDYTRLYCEAQGFPAKDVIAADTAVQFVQGLEIDTPARFAALEAAIETLSVEQRKCIELFYLSKMNYKDIATATAYSLANVKNALRSGKQYLKEQLERTKA
jgi:RNA polymerase sigma factor (sigma-70 family)